MLLQADPGLAEVPGFSTEQLESLSRSIEQKKHKLEADIQAYIKKKQRELAQYEQELLAQYREMERGETRESTDKNSMHAESQNAKLPTDLPTDSPTPPAQPVDTSLESRKEEEKAKRTKHTRVHKREKELCGLVTPIFLPLLDAGEGSPTKKEKKKRRHKEKTEATGNSPPSDQGSPSRDAEKGKDHRVSRRKSSEKMVQAEVVKGDAPKEHKTPEPTKKSKRPAMKKSSLRHSGERSRRKRVSLVIDDQIVLPAEEVLGPPLTSPSETTVSSASNSTTSLDDAIDPRLLARNDTPFHEHQDPVHHSLPLPMSLPSASPTKHTGHTIAESPVSRSPDLPSPRSPLSPRSPAVQYEPPQTATRTFLDPSPPNDPVNIPQHAGPAPIYASEPEQAEAGEEEFSTYVGGIHGSGVDDVDQTGSLGYPSSLGASYLESYMQSRPLSVRMAAADKAGLSANEKARLMKGKSRDHDDVDLDIGRVEDVDDGMEIMGGMEGF